MPGKIKSTAQRAYLAIHRPAILKELAGGVKLPKNLPEHVAPTPKRPYTVNAHVRRGQATKLR